LRDQVDGASPRQRDRPGNPRRAKTVISMRQQPNPILSTGRTSPTFAASAMVSTSLRSTAPMGWHSRRVVGAHDRQILAQQPQERIIREPVIYIDPQKVIGSLTLR
jgi:hypothetical protein